MERWESVVDRQIREAIEAGEFDNLPGKGQPLPVDFSPFEQPLDATIRRIFRDNGVTHPVLEARRAIDDELAGARADFLRTRSEESFRQRLHSLNREIRLFNLRSPVPNFHLPILDIDNEMTALRERNS